MCKELVKRLRDYEETGLSAISPYEAGEAADAIEELSRKVEDLEAVHEISPEAEYAINKHADNLISHMEELISGLKDKPRWIPVTERLPKRDEEEVLVCNEDYGKTGLGFVTVAVWDGSEWISAWNRTSVLHCITHWMPLPPAPESSEDAK